MREDDLGSIEPGNRADLLALNADYFAVPEEQIKRIRPVVTVVAGTSDRKKMLETQRVSALLARSEGAAGIQPLLSAGRRVGS